MSPNGARFSPAIVSCNAPVDPGKIFGLGLVQCGGSRKTQGAKKGRPQNRHKEKVTKCAIRRHMSFGSGRTLAASTPIDSSARARSRGHRPSSCAKLRDGDGGASTARYARPRRTDATMVYSPNRACAVDPTLHGRRWTTHAHESTTRVAKTATTARGRTRTPREASKSETSPDRFSTPRSVVSVNPTSIFFKPFFSKKNPFFSFSF
jgi:hypothetical protein